MDDGETPPGLRHTRGKVLEDYRTSRRIATKDASHIGGEHATVLAVGDGERPVARHIFASVANERDIVFARARPGDSKASKELDAKGAGVTLKSAPARL